MLPESMEFVSKGGGNCKYRNMTVKATGWKLKVMPLWAWNLQVVETEGKVIKLEFAGTGI